MDTILTGASRGIGLALALALPESVRLHAVARDEAALAELVRTRPNTVAHACDLSSLTDATKLGEVLAGAIAGPPATLIHNAGLWPTEKELRDGLERAFLVNCAGPLALQRPLLASTKLSRVFVVGAGLMIKGRFDATKTPFGADFSWFRTYASTKLAFAAAMRDVAREHPAIDVAVMHPGVARTDLGARRGVLGWLVDRVKKSWESPETCAARVAMLLEQTRLSSAGDASWYVELERRPWPESVGAAAPDVRTALATIFD